MSSVPPLPEDDDLRAAEFAFGLLEGAEFADAERRFDTEPGFAAAVGQWRAHATSMLPAAREAPRPSLWTAIEQQLSGAAPVVLRSVLRRWKAATAFMSALAAALFLALVIRPAPPPKIVQAPPRTVFIAVLTGQKSSAVVAVTIRRDGQWTAAPGKLVVTGHVPELWVIPPGDKPRALGVISPATRSRDQAPPDLASVIVPGATLAVSIEPIGGSPTGQPTGPVILTGAVAAA